TKWRCGSGWRFTCGKAPRSRSCRTSPCRATTWTSTCSGRTTGRTWRPTPAARCRRCCRSCGRPRGGRCRGWTGTAAATTRNRRSCARSRSGGGARSGAMAVRQFDGVDDDIRHTVGSALADMAYGTFAALIKPQAPLDDYGTILSLVTSGNVLRVQWYYDATTSWSDLYVP